MGHPELTVEQCRTLARIRRRAVGAEVRLHRLREGIVVEVRRGRHSELAHLDSAGGVRLEQRLRLAA